MTQVTNKPVVLVDFTEYMNLLKIRDEFEAMQKTSQPLNTLEHDLNSVPLPVKEDLSKFEYEGKQYGLLAESKIKVRGILDKLGAHPKIGPALKAALTKEDYEAIGKVWLPVVVYKCLYDNPDGQIWTRMQEEFKTKFKPL